MSQVIYISIFNILCFLFNIICRNTTVDLSHIETPANMTHWPLFHNGVAAGLRIANSSQVRGYLKIILCGIIFVWPILRLQSFYVINAVNYSETCLQGTP